MNNDLAERIKDCMSKAGVNNEKLALECGVKPPTSFHWASGKTKKIKAEPLLKAAKLFGVTPEWLASGTQPKYPPNGSAPSIQEPKYPPNGSAPSIQEPSVPYFKPLQLDPMEGELLHLFGRLDIAHKHEYLGRLRGFIEGIDACTKDPPSDQSPPANNERTGTHA